MTSAARTAAWLESDLPRILAEHAVPGAAVAVLVEGEIVEHAAGVLNLRTGVEATPDSVFQIGSITKLWTATLAMQLVDEGRIDLDEPIRTYLPEFALADEQAARTITMRHLLAHTAGFEGDVFTDTGRGDDCVEKYVASLADDPQLFAPGELFSYNNAGYCVIGRVVEVLRGKPWNQCVLDLLATPLGLTHVSPDAEQAILFRAALGHIRPAEGEAPVPAPMWSLVRSNGPAGSALAMQARDLVTFVRMHLDGGVAVDGTRVLGEGSVTAMQTEQTAVPAVTRMGDAWGLGWELFDLDGTRVIGHDGGTIGQYAFLRVVPEHRLVVALLTNGGDALDVCEAVLGHLLGDLAGVHLPTETVPPEAAAAVDVSRWIGDYASEVVDYAVTADADGRVWLDETPKGVLVELGGAKPEHRELVPLDADRAIAREARSGMYEIAAFLGDDGTGQAQYLHNGRAMRRAR